MLYVIYGTDTHKARTKLHKLVDTLLEKKPDAAYASLTMKHSHEMLLQNIHKPEVCLQKEPSYF